LRNLFNKSIFLSLPLKAGTILEREHLVLKKPGTGIPAARLEDIVGMRLTRDYDSEMMLQEVDLESR
jgi:sialic acid synthase SpsE